MKTWIAIPILGVAAAAFAFVLQGSAAEVICAAVMGAAIVHALRAFAGDSPATLVGAGAGALLAVALLQHAAVPSLALAAACWTFAELARPSVAYIALAPAIVAAILEPGFVSLVAIAGARLVPREPEARAAVRPNSEGEEGRPAERARGRGSRERLYNKQRWRIAIPIAGVCGVVLAVIAGAADGGALGALGERWFGHAHPTSSGNALALLGDALGPLVVVGALAGLGALARVHLASLAIIACACGVLLVDLRAGIPPATTLGLAAVLVGAGIGRLAGMVRIPSGQAVVAATCGVLLLLPMIIART